MTPSSPSADGASATEVRDNSDRHRFELWLGDQRAGVLTYREEDGSLALLHTEVYRAFSGEGLGAEFVQAVLDTLRDAGRTVLPYCPFVKTWLRAHPSYVDLVPEAERDAFGLLGGSRED